MSMFLDKNSLTNSITMSVVRKITEQTDINAFDDGYDTVREMVQSIVDEFISIANSRAYQLGRFVYVHDDSLGDTLTDTVLRELHKQSRIDGVVDLVETTKKKCSALVAAFNGDWNYRYFNKKAF